MQIRELDVVRLVRAIPDSGLEAGATGTVVRAYGGDDYEVEFCDAHGVTVSMLALPASALEVSWKYPWPGRTT